MAGSPQRHTNLGVSNRDQTAHQRLLTMVFNDIAHLRPQSMREFLSYRRGRRAIYHRPARCALSVLLDNARFWEGLEKSQVPTLPQPCGPALTRSCNLAQGTCICSAPVPAATLPARARCTARGLCLHEHLTLVDDSSMMASLVVGCHRSQAGRSCS
jgi:hypothetical protein